MSKTFVEKIATFVKGHKRRLEEISRGTKFTNGVTQYGNSVNSPLTHGNFIQFNWKSHRILCATRQTDSKAHIKKVLRFGWTIW